MDRSSRKPSRMTLLPLNPLVRRIKGNHAAVIRLLSKGLGRCRKALKLLAFLNLVSHSHSMQSNAFRLVSVYPVRSRDSNSTDYLYSPCSTASVYHFFISVIKRLLCRGSRGLFLWSHYTASLIFKQVLLSAKDSVQGQVCFYGAV